MDASLRYEFFTPHHRGFDLVWQFLCSQPKASFSDGILTAKASYGYERACRLAVSADEQQIGNHTELWERFSALAPVFHSFWDTLEQAATDWQDQKRTTEVSEAAKSKRRDEEICARVLSVAAQHKTGPTP